MRSPGLSVGLILAPALVVVDGIEPPSVASRVEVVRVDVAVTDREGRPDPDLTADDDDDPGFEVTFREELQVREWSYTLDHDGLERLAEATGGLFIHDTDPGKGLAQALLDQSGYYLLGYAAPAGGEPRFHCVSGTIKRPGLRVRARSGYWGGR